MSLENSDSENLFWKRQGEEKKKAKETLMTVIVGTKKLLASGKTKKKKIRNLLKTKKKRDGERNEFVGALGEGGKKKKFPESRQREKQNSTQ